MAAPQRRLRSLAAALATPHRCAAEPPSVEALSGDSGFQPMVPWAAKGYHTNEGYYESFTGGGGCTADGLIRKCSMLRLRGDGARPLFACPSAVHIDMRVGWGARQATPC